MSAAQLSPFYLFISGFSPFISNSRSASSYLRSPSLECLYLPTFFLLFVCSFQVTLMAFNFIFDRFSIKVVSFSSFFCCCFHSFRSGTGMLHLLVFVSSWSCFGGRKASPLRHCCFLVTGQRRSLRRETQLHRDGSLTLHLSQLVA